MTGQVSAGKGIIYTVSVRGPRENFHGQGAARVSENALVSSQGNCHHCRQLSPSEQCRLMDQIKSAQAVAAWITLLHHLSAGPAQSDSGGQHMQLIGRVSLLSFDGPGMQTLWAASVGSNDLIAEAEESAARSKNACGRRVCHGLARMV